MNNETNTEIAELKAKLDIYEKWHNEDSNLKSSISASQSVDDEIDLKELWKGIWQGKWKITAITFVFAVTSVLYTLSLPNIYTSEAVLMPNSQDSKAGGLGAIAGQFGGLASLAGINLGGGRTDKTGYALEVLKSRKFLYKFIEDNELKVQLMAIKKWDKNTNKLIYDEDIYTPSTKEWVSSTMEQGTREPSTFSTYNSFVNNNLKVIKDQTSGMVTISVDHYSPIIAKKIVDDLILAINNTIKLQDLSESTKSISYLRKELELTEVAGMQSMFYQLIEQQQQTLMLTKVRDDYVLKIIDPPIISESYGKPNRKIIVMIATILGFISSLFGIIAMYFYKKQK
jgi:uncharacterized protein involved in exopolysaccharide biosynthesis